MNHTIDFSIVKKVENRLLVSQVHFDELRKNSCNGLNTFQHFYAGIRKVVDDDHLVTRILEFHYRV